MITYLNDNLDGDTLSGEYSLPKIKGKFKGDHTPEFHMVCDSLNTHELPRDTHQSLHSHDHEKEEKEVVFSGTPFVVMKVRDMSQDVNNNKVFVNVCVQDSSMASDEVVIGDDCPRMVQDKKGDTSTTFDVCVNSAALDSATQQEQVGHNECFVHFA